MAKYRSTMMVQRSSVISNGAGYRPQRNPYYDVKGEENVFLNFKVGNSIT